MMMLRSGDLNLCISAQAFGESAMDSLKQTVIQQELIFRSQVRELHRLYWTQKNLMNDLRRSWAATTDFTESSSEKKKNEFYMLSGTREMGIPLAQNVAVLDDFDGKNAQIFGNHGRNFGICVTSDEFMKGTMKDLVDSVPVLDVWKGCETADVDGRGMLRPSCKEVIDLEDTEEFECYEEANEVDGFKSPIQNGAGVSGLHTTVARDQVSLSMMGCNSGHMPSMIHLNEGNGERLQEHKCALSSPGLGNSYVTTTSRIKEQAGPVPPFDLNMPQVSDCSDDVNDPAETNPVILGSSIVHDGFHNHEWNCSCLVEASFSPKLVSSKSSFESRADWLNCPSQDSKCYCSLDYKHAIDNKDNNNTERTVDIKILASASQVRAECCGNLVKRSADTNNGPFVRSKQNAVSISTADECNQGKKNIDFGSGKQRSAGCSVDKRQNSNITSSNSTNLRQKGARDSVDKVSNHEGSEEDTLTSHSSAQDEAQCSTPSQKSPARCNSDGITIKNMCSSHYTSAGKTATVSNTDDSVTTQVNSPRNEGSSMGKLKAVECDITITAAAEALMGISLGLSSIPTKQSDGFQMLEAEGDDRSNRPLYSFDSFEYMTLQLSEVQSEDHRSVDEPANVNVTGNNTSRLRLRRGRRLRDFQKDILLGLVSLSRHEICEDLHNIGYNLRRTTFRNASENWFVPARSQRSRLYSGCRRR